MANTWFVCIDPSDKGKPVSRLEQVDFRIQVKTNNPNYHILMTGGTINWGGQPLTRWKGPYATEAEAKKAQNPVQQSPNPLTDLKSAAVNSNLNPLGALFQANIWMRVGEVVLGLILIAIGVAELTHAVPVATKIASVMK
jgi:hypothetical protein